MSTATNPATKKPEKYISLFHLGQAKPVAYFGENEAEAVFCLQQLNKNVVIKKGGFFNKEALLMSDFYYLTGESGNEFCQYVDMDTAGAIWDDFRWNERILKTDGDRNGRQERLEVRPDPMDAYKPKHGGRKNSENKK